MLAQTQTTQSLSELFAIALQLERAAQILYTKWSEAFAEHPDVVAFWDAYAKEEAYHAKLLEERRAELTREQLMEPTNASAFEAVFSLLNNLQRRESTIKNLEDAYSFARRIENSEMNSFFEFLIGQSQLSADEMNALHDGLSRHIARLESEFPQTLQDPENRRAIKVKKL